MVKLDFRQETDNKTHKVLKKIELLECGHQNNLNLDTRESGVCPKGCTKDVKGIITKG